MEELMKEIAAWHEKTFDTTSEAQHLKLVEELNEVLEAKDQDEWYKEMADVLFVLAALVYRFKDPVGKAMLTITLCTCNKDQLRLFKELHAKFEKNKKRVWIKQPDGTYHHAPNTD